MLLKTIQEQEEFIKNKTDELTEQAAAKGFDSLGSVRKAILSDTEAKDYAEKKKKHEEDFYLCQTNLKREKEALEAKRAENFEEKPLEEIEDDLNAIEHQKTMSHQYIGGEERLLEQEQAKQKDYDLLTVSIEEQEKNYQRWQMLNDLIGSADGAKFRRFAQTITLEHLVILANRHLDKFLDARYSIARRNNEDLELDIIDTHQSDHRRPLETLSGGETFLTSLALALGLADLSVGSRTKTDTLFIDEGFGTLSQDVLNIAIKVLQVLESEGKTIGSISHVEQLKNEIFPQVQVKKKGNGRSTVEIVSG
jgi:exonuclease SbcC